MALTQKIKISLSSEHFKFNPMKFHSFHFLVLFLLLISYCLKAQNDNSAFCIPHTINPADSNKLFLGIENGNYFKNNYYFNNFEAGYKEIGYFVQPTLSYFPNSRTKITAGIHLLKYSGLTNFTQQQPVFSFQYHIYDGLDMVLGTLYGTTNHRLVEPIFQFDRYMNDHVENGLQFLLDRDRLRSDLWLNWERFIFDLSPVQEIFTVGSSSSLRITNKESNWQIRLPLQTVITHHGGMHTTQSAPIQTLFNLVYGVETEYKLGGRLFHTIGFRGYAMHYVDLTTLYNVPYKNGYGFYPNFLVEGKHFDLMAGFWNANRFIAPRGEYLFQSVSSKDSSYSEAKRQLVTFKLTYHHTIMKGIELGSRLESYYDTRHGNLDYTYSVYILFNKRFFLKELN
jgi:hypothetical protein